MVDKIVSQSELARQLNCSRAAINKASRDWPEDAFRGRKVCLEHPEVYKFIQKRKAEQAAKPAEPAQGIDPLWEHALAHCYDSGDWSIIGLKRGLNVGHARAKSIIKAFEVSELLPGMRRHSPPVVPSQPRRNTTPDPNTKPGFTDEQRAEWTSVESQVPEELREFLDWSLRDLMVKFGTHTSFKEWLKSVKEIEMIEEKRIKNAQLRGGLVTRELMERVIDIFDTQHMRLLKDGAKSISAEVISKDKGGSDVAEIEEHVSKRMGTFITAAKSKIQRIELRGRSY